MTRAVCFGMGASGNNPNGTPDLSGIDAPTAAESSAPPPMFPSGEKPADMVGPYKLLELIGEGGFGMVWLAERREPIVQQVALKILNPGMDSREILARFEQERQALAVMNHPNVAMVIDAGATPSGRPYFAMEYVPGESITAYCDRHKLSIRERLQLFIPVCEAVQHAHHKGIIHRDLKPSNILVAVHEGRAVPKVIDFGVAKAVSHTLTQKTIFTEHGKLIGTPEYMSPEQAEMGATDVDTRTDVYALGVVLYELLSGLLPFDAKMLREGGLLAICRIIREQEPPRPSTRLSTIADADSKMLATNRHTQREQLSRELRRELDWIPLKAIRKDRAERYDTPMDLAQDIQRYLNGEALEAGPPSTIYRLGKLARRHRTAIIASAIVLIAVAAGASSTVIALSRAAAQAVIAEASNRRAEGTKEFSRQVISALEPSGSFEAIRTRTLALIDKAIANTNVAFDGDSTTRPEVLNTIGLSFRAAGKLDLAEPCLRRAFEMRRAALGVDNPATWLSAHELAYLYDDMGKAAEAEPLARQAVAEQTRLFGVLHNDTLASIQLLGVILVSRAGTAQEGQQLLENTLRSSREIWGPDSVRTASLESNVAQCYKKADQIERATPLYEHALGVTKTQLGDDDPETLA
ncbi:MAG: serine/threonine protein kinase, partial [Planctomycetaceae bacterium]|nr:serine/threonine protein kinase [Planctomycetaceae bacterium]